MNIVIDFETLISLYFLKAYICLYILSSVQSFAIFLFFFIVTTFNATTRDEIIEKIWLAENNLAYGQLRMLIARSSSKETVS